MGTTSGMPVTQLIPALKSVWPGMMPTPVPLRSPCSCSRSQSLRSFRSHRSQVKVPPRVDAGSAAFLPT
ncbi:hypothetical protein VFPPC_16232 [Pochonia chlamydosporia 170]|uniref:Uncharacterized protein n=1 Tax=Pochonia chlamydosporia 170 TaxID=1380566 RepID=A0A179FGA3_METCM|nr:hypothetical protein VFPPC_16232 [Pochonia chlamydosporia 170]OAQ64566.1 hypothetical protein VFPPC_16232 [Pochonia chlamydosporia 170]